MSKPVKGSRTYRSPVRERNSERHGAAVIEAAATCSSTRGTRRRRSPRSQCCRGLAGDGVRLVRHQARGPPRRVETASTGVAEGGAVVGADLIERVRPSPTRVVDSTSWPKRPKTRSVRVGPARRSGAGGGGGDPEIAALAREHEAQRLRDDPRPRVVARPRSEPLRMSERDAADVMWALARSTGFYRNLAVDRGWSQAHGPSGRSMTPSPARSWPTDAAGGLLALVN